MTSLASMIPGIYRWKAQAIPEPDPEEAPLDAGVPLPTQDIIRDAMTRLLETIGNDFRMAPHAGSVSRDLDSEMGQIDQEIERIRSIMLAVKHDLGRRVALLCKRRNVMAPFNRLPPELVGLVLSHIIPQPPTSPYRSFSSAHYNTLRTLSNVVKISTGWWHVIKSCPALWTTIANIPNEDTELKLRHSGNLPLNIVHTRNYAPNPLHFITSVVAQSARWKSVHLELDPEELDYIREPMRNAMPYLERLEIQCYEDPEDLTCIDLPASNVLRCVSVLGISLNPSSPVLRSLQHLTLGGTDMIPIRHVLATLASTIALESLTIRSFDDTSLEMEAEHVAIQRQPPIHLSSLISLTIEDTPSPYIVALLDGIRASNLASLRVEAVEDNDDDGRVALQRLIQLHNQPSILADVITRSAVMLIKMRVGGTDLLEIIGEATDKEEGIPDPVSIRLFHEEWFDFLRNLEHFSTFAASLPPVHLDLASSTAAATLNFLLGMPSITIIEFAASDVICQEQLQLVLSHSYVIDGNDVWALPKLTEIRLRQAEFEGDLDTLMPGVLRALQEREQAGQGGQLPKITFKRRVYHNTSRTFEYITMT